MPSSFDPNRTHRFYVEFPESYSIPNWAVNSMECPRIKYGNKKYLFGLIKRKNIKIESIEMKILDIIGYKLTAKLHNLSNLKTVEFKYFHLNPNGDVIEKWEVKADLISIDLGKLDYSIDDVRYIKIKVTPFELNGYFPKK